MAEEEVPAASEKVLKIQRVFINQLDTYSSGNIGKVRGGSASQPGPQPSVCCPGPSPQQRSAPQAVVRKEPPREKIPILASQCLQDLSPTRLDPCTFLETQALATANQTPIPTSLYMGRPRLKERVCKDHIANNRQDVDRQVVSPAVMSPLLNLLFCARHKF